MLVRERMSSPVITVSPDLPISEALMLMREKNIRRTPVVENGEIVGIISDKDLFDVAPALKSYLKDWEQKYLENQITVSQVMRPRVLTVDENLAIEEAAMIMADNKIGGLPVTRNGKLIGMITETDLFKLFIEMLGARDKGVRMTIMMKDVPGEFAKLTNVVAKVNGNIVAFSTFEGKNQDEREVTMKVTGVTQDELNNMISPLALSVIDIRTV